MTIQQLIRNFIDLINNLIIPLLVALTVVALFYGIFKYVWGGGANDKGEGTKVMTAGIIGLVVMLSMWGIVVLVSNSFGISGQQVINLPKIGQ